MGDNHGPNGSLDRLSERLQDALPVVHGASEDVAKACSNDHPKCKAYQYLPLMSYGGGYGYLCTSVFEDRTILNSEFCIKSQGYI